MTDFRNVTKCLFCIALVVALAACAGTRTKESTGEYIDDSAITAKVKAALIADPVTKAHQIEVETFKGTVQLSGFVSTAQEKDKAGEIARGVKGVERVQNNISLTRTKESAGEYIDDSVITSKVKAALIADPVTKARQIEVETLKGTVQLSGFVNTTQEKEKASEIARGVKGVVDVQNKLIVK